VINSSEIKLKRKATQFVKVDAGQEVGVLRWLAHEKGNSHRSLSNNSCY